MIGCHQRPSLASTTPPAGATAATFKPRGFLGHATGHMRLLADGRPPYSAGGSFKRFGHCRDALIADGFDNYRILLGSTTVQGVGQKLLK